MQMLADGITPRKTKYQTQKDFLRTAIEESTATSCSLEEFQNQLSEKFNITLKISRGRFSYLHPERNKPITGKKLGTHYERKYLLKLLEENQKHLSQKNVEHEPLPDSNISNKAGISSTNEETLPEPFILSLIHI